MCNEGDQEQPIPSRNKNELNKLVAQLHEAMRETTERIQQATDFDKLKYEVPDHDYATIT